jgi:transcriptional regulator with XRE-family HTH domain
LIGGGDVEPSGSGPHAVLVGRGSLGIELREIREHARLSTRQLGARLGLSQATISLRELGKRATTPGEARRWAEACGLDQNAVEALVTLAERAEAELVTWRHALRRTGLPGLQTEVAALEAVARSISVYRPLGIPGLLQTPAYAQAVFLSGNPPGPEIGQAVEARMRRQSILYEPGRRFRFLLTEASLRWGVGDARVQREQMDRLRQAMTLEGVGVGLLAFDRPVAAWRSHGFVLFQDRGDGGDPFVSVEIRHGGASASNGDDVQLYAETFERLDALALHGEQALALMGDY